MSENREPFDKDKNLQEWIKIMYAKTEEHTKEITNSRVCTLNKFSEIRGDIKDLKAELKQDIQAMSKEQSTQCRYNHEGVDNAMKKKADNTLIWSFFIFIILPFSLWVGTMVFDNNKYIEGHKIQVKTIEKFLEKHDIQLTK